MPTTQTAKTDFRISDDDVRWLKHYLDNASPPGNEVNGQKLWLEYIKPFIHDYFTDHYGNVAAVINPGAAFKVVIEAHADEIAWYVHTITKEGFLHVKKNGGTDPGIAPSQHVNIRTASGVVKAVFGWPAIHTQNGSHSVEPKSNNIFIDCGCRSKQEVEELGIQVGDCITYESGFRVLNKRFFVGRGQDNKIGGYMIAAVARLIHQHGIELPFGLYVVNSVQEEVGLRGAGLMANLIQPNCAVITDVTHATHTPLVDKSQQGDLDLTKGPVIVKSPSVHNKLRELIIGTAREEKIPYQLAVSSKKTGTDTDSFAYSNTGIPSALVSLPLRYMHTTVETTSRKDIENCISLLYATLMRLSPDFNFKYL
jgi:putative aminopeptidase FrvX